MAVYAEKRNPKKNSLCGGWDANPYQNWCTWVCHQLPIQELTHKITVRRPWKESREECGLVCVLWHRVVQVVRQWGEEEGERSNTVSSSHPSKFTALHMVTLEISSWQQHSTKSLLKLHLNEQDKEYFVLMLSSTMENNVRERSLWNPGTSVILTIYSSGTSISWLLIWSMMSWGGFPSTVHPTDCKQK